MTALWARLRCLLVLGVPHKLLLPPWRRSLEWLPPLWPGHAAAGATPPALRTARAADTARKAAPPLLGGRCSAAPLELLPRESSRGGGAAVVPSPKFKATCGPCISRKAALLPSSRHPSANTSTAQAPHLLCGPYATPTCRWLASKSCNREGAVSSRIRSWTISAAVAPALPNHMI